MIRKYFPDLYKILCDKDHTDKETRDSKKARLQEANARIALASRERITGHLTFSDWKSYSSNDGFNPPQSIQGDNRATKRRKTLDASDKITSRFIPSEEIKIRSAQVPWGSDSRPWSCMIRKKWHLFEILVFLIFFSFSRLCRHVQASIQGYNALRCFLSIACVMNARNAM